MSTLIVGAGAVGGYFAAKLAAHRDVSVLARGSRADLLREHGLSLIDPDGTTTITRLSVRTASELSAPVDLVILAVKASALPGALDDMSGAVGPNTVILPLLNGIAHLDVLEARFPGQTLGGVCIVATELDDGAIHQLMPGASITYGELDGSPSTPRLSTVAAELEGAEFEVVASTSIVQDMWEKWLFMAVGGAAGVLFGAPAGAITAAEGGADSIEAVLAEAAAILAAAGHEPRQAILDRVRGALLAPGSAFTTSLYRDYLRGGPTEGEAILGDLTRLGARLEVPHPLLAAATVRLRIRRP